MKRIINNINRRGLGQVEIIGLVVVVIIIVIGVLFYIGFGLKKAPQKESSIEIGYASNLLSSVLNVQVCNNTKQISEAIVACFNDQQICDMDACDYVKSETKVIMDRIDIKEFENYYFYAERGSEKKEFSKECKFGTQVDSKIVGPSNENYQVNLKLC